MEHRPIANHEIDDHPNHHEEEEEEEEEVDPSVFSKDEDGDDPVKRHPLSYPLCSLSLVLSLCSHQRNNCLSMMRPLDPRNRSEEGDQKNQWTS